MMEKHRDIALDVHQLTGEKWNGSSIQKSGKAPALVGVSPAAAEANKKLRGLGSTNSLKEKRPPTEAALLEQRKDEAGQE